MAMPIEEPSDARRLDGQLLSDLWVFRAAARLRSVTAAGRRLGVTQGAVSRRVLRLEGRLGTALFIRQKGGVALTDAGASLLEAMTQVAGILNERLSCIDRRQSQAIVVSCIPSLATEWLVPHLDAFYARHPGIEVFVRAEMPPMTVGWLEDNGIDLVIGYQPVAPAGLHQLAELREYVLPVCAPAYRERVLRKGAADTPVLLHDDSACPDAPRDFEWSSWRAATGSDWPGRPANTRHFNLAHLANHAAMCGQGVAVGRAILVNRLLSKGDLVPAFNGAPAPGSVYRVLTHRPGDASSPVRQFARWWSEAMADTQAATFAKLCVTAPHRSLQP